MSHSQTQAMYSPKPPKIITKFSPKSSQNPPQTIPKRSQKHPKSVKIPILVPKMTKAKKKLPGLNVALAPGRHFGAQSVPSEAQERPKSSQNIPQNVKKSTSKNM